MFTGIVEERGTVVALDQARLTVGCVQIPRDSPIGGSVAVNGTCLTVVERDGDRLSFDVSEETFARTTLGRLREGDPVNLERPVTLAARLGGHIVQGHVDGVGSVIAIDPEAGGARIRLEVPLDLLPYLVEKGSVTVDGVSLTVSDLHPDGISVALIPHTLAVTTLGQVAPGDPVNLEVDVIAKYVERLMEGTRP